ncbi:uncharacterized protein LOC105420978 [Amborella trichopoda]|uniref:uncharacterized protein LOC105420978 n=1 Tax=Amborella trichopoda TaxID=13333 RepID=UPI0005D3AF28|nr:uncharacterized protein LOC105420978 [Amborella trichopoda]|eukprot:XP_011624992.1 uncharacterized protein LOC105420978 [Amborella trichopoda]
MGLHAQSRNADCRGIIRNDTSGFIASFAAPLGFISNNILEFLTLEKGISLARKLNCVSLVIESDSKHLVNAMSSHCRPLWRLCIILVKCIYVLVSLDDHRWIIQHAYKEVNMIADSLAKETVSMNVATMWRTCPPEFVTPFILSNVASVSLTRVV